MPQIGFDHHEAHRAIDEFLADGMDRWIAAAETPIEGRPQFALHTTAAHIVSEETLRGLQERAYAYDDLIKKKDDAHLPAGYRPFLHSPNASTDRLIPWEPYTDAIAHVFYDKDYAELDKDSAEHHRVRAAAITCTFAATLDPDTDGAVPILSWATSAGQPESRKLWQMAYTTPVAGLYVRASGNNPFFDEFAVVVACGYRMVGGFFSREAATEFAVEVAKAVPAVDWLTLGPDGFTKEVAAKVREVWSAHGPTAGSKKAEPATT